MRVRRVTISHFRGVAHGVIDLGTDNLLVGANSVGKSTVCEALDLVLGAERMFRRPVIDEYDFHRGDYLPTNADELPQVRIDVILADLDAETRRKFAFHVQLWEDDTDGWVTPEGDTSSVSDEQWCLPVAFIGRYNAEEDDFEGGTYFAHPERPVDDFGRERTGPGGGLAPFTREDKRLCGFLYLRANRTGTRALSFGRGSLLDTIARLETAHRDEAGAPLWAETLTTVANLELDSGTAGLGHVLDEVTARARRFVNLSDDQSVTAHVSELTREHLREVLRVFIATRPGSYPVPLPRLSTGTANLMVFALLTYIAELRGSNSVIFVMEEPEIALPPHAQRRMVAHVRANMGQAIVTSHSPYVLDQFAPSDIVVLRRDTSGQLSSSALTLPDKLAGKRYRRERRQFAEAVLARAVAVVEGATEITVFAATAERLAHLDPDYVDPDLDGITFYNAGSDTAVPTYAPIFAALGKRTYGWHDKLGAPLTAEQAQDAEQFDLYVEHQHDGMEDLLCAEIPIEVQRRFADTIAARPDYPTHCGPTPAGLGPDLTAHVRTVLIARKSDHDSYAALLITEAASIEELPASIVTFLRDMHDDLDSATAPAPFDTVLDPDGVGGPDDPADPLAVDETVANDAAVADGTDGEQPASDTPVVDQTAGSGSAAAPTTSKTPPEQ